MRFRLRAADDVFVALLRRSADGLVGGATVLAEMFDETADLEQLGKRMKEADRDTDDITRSIIRCANTTVFTPFDRHDIFALASGLDDVMDAMEEALDLVNVYEVRHLPEQVAGQVEVLQRAAEITADTMPRLGALKGLDDHWVEIRRLEKLGDQVYRQLLADLVNHRHEPMHVLKVKDVVDSLENAMDAFEDVADTLQQIALKEK